MATEHFNCIINVVLDINLCQGKNKQGSHHKCLHCPFLFPCNKKHVFPFSCRCTIGTYTMGYKATSMYCVLRCLCFMLLHLLSAAQDEDLRSKNASVFIFSQFFMLAVHTLKTVKMISCTMKAFHLTYFTKLNMIKLN